MGAEGWRQLGLEGLEVIPSWGQGAWRSVAQDGQGMGLEAYGPGGSCNIRIGWRWVLAMTEHCTLLRFLVMVVGLLVAG